MHGRPPHTAGSTVIRSSSLISAPVADGSLSPILPRAEGAREGRAGSAWGSLLVSGVAVVAPGASQPGRAQKRGGCDSRPGRSDAKRGG